MSDFEIGDFFAGAGGFTTGALRAIHTAGYTANVTAVNHWWPAVATHQANHPDGRHFCLDLATARPEVVLPGLYLDLLLASPECTHHSIARGGKPTSDQQRAGAFLLTEWLTRVRVPRLLVENVPEWEQWVPVDPATEKPDPTRRGQFFQAWVGVLRALGYDVEWRVLNSADYGAPTSRRRLFVIARNDGAPIRWPDRTHARDGSVGLRHRPASDVIDWSDLGESLFERRRKPLSEKTCRKIHRGFTKFAGALAPHFARLLWALHDGVPSDDWQILSVETRGTPLPTSSFLIHYYGTGGASSVDAPLPTITTKPRFALVTPVARPFLIPNFGERQGQAPRVHAISDPLPTVTSHGAGALVVPVVEVATGTTMDRRRLLMIDGKLHVLDIRYRMLRNYELSRAMGFDRRERYEFFGKDHEITRQIGNAVQCDMAEALVRTILDLDIVQPERVAS